MKKVKKPLALILTLLLVFTLAACAKQKQAEPVAKKPQVLTVQLVPSKSPLRLQTKARPLEKALSRRLKMPVHLSVASNYNTLIQAMKAKKVSVGFLPPNVYVLAHQKGAAELLLRAERYQKQRIRGRVRRVIRKNYRAEILVKKSSKIRSWRALKGKRIAVQNPLASAGYLFPVAELKKKGLNVLKSCKLITVSGYDQAVLSVLNGDVDATFTFADARNLVKAEHPHIKQQVVPIYFTKAIPNDVIAVNPALSKKVRQKIARAFIALSKTKEGRHLLHQIYGHDAYCPARDKDYDIVRRADKTIEPPKK